MRNQAEVFELVENGIAKAEAKFPLWPIDIIHGAAIVGEEAGEVLKAALQHTYESKEYGPCLDEAIHTAATAMRFISAHLYGDMDNKNNKQI